MNIGHNLLTLFSNVIDAVFIAELRKPFKHEMFVEEAYLSLGDRFQPNAHRTLNNDIRNELDKEL